MSQFMDAMVELETAFREDDEQHKDSYPVHLDLKEGPSRDDVMRYITDFAPNLDFKLYMRPILVGDRVVMVYRIRMLEEEANRFVVLLRFRFT